MIIEVLSAPRVLVKAVIDPILAAASHNVIHIFLRGTQRTSDDGMF